MMKRLKTLLLVTVLLAAILGAYVFGIWIGKQRQFAVQVRLRARDCLTVLYQSKQTGAPLDKSLIEDRLLECVPHLEGLVTGPCTIGKEKKPLENQLTYTAQYFQEMGIQYTRRTRPQTTFRGVPLPPQEVFEKRRGDGTTKQSSAEVFATFQKALPVLQHYGYSLTTDPQQQRP